MISFISLFNFPIFKEIPLSHIKTIPDSNPRLEDGLFILSFNLSSKTCWSYGFNLHFNEIRSHFTMFIVLLLQLGSLLNVGSTGSVSL